MPRLMTYESYMNSLAEKVIDNTRQLKRGVNQRRNGMEDLFGICYSAQGDATHAAKFYISISPDYVYLQRFAFKIVVRSYKSSVAGAGGSTLEIGSTELTVPKDEAYIIDGTSTLDERSGNVSPNPHTHSAAGEITGLTYGIKEIDTVSSNWRIEIHDIDITDYLKEQQDGNWISGRGVYPTHRGLDGVEDFYDILDVASVMYAEGRDDDAWKLIKPEFKDVKIYSDAPFAVDAYLYLKYSNVSR